MTAALQRPVWHLRSTPINTVPCPFQTVQVPPYDELLQRMNQVTGWPAGIMRLTYIPILRQADRCLSVDEARDVVQGILSPVSDGCASGEERQRWVNAVATILVKDETLRDAIFPKP